MTNARRRPFILVKVRVGKKAAALDLTNRVISFSYEDTEKKADQIKLTVDNFDLANFDDPIWKKGNVLEVTWGYPDNFAPPRFAVIQKVTGGPVLTIEAHGPEAMLNRQVNSFTWKDMSYADIAKKIATRHGYVDEGTQIIEETDAAIEVRDRVVQGRRTDAQFMRRLATKLGFEFFIDFDGFHFHKRDMGAPVSREFEYYTSRTGDILSFTVDNDITRKAAIVRSAGREPLAKVILDFIADNTSVPERGSTGAIAEQLGIIANQDPNNTYSRQQIVDDVEKADQFKGLQATVISWLKKEENRQQLGKRVQDGALLTGMVIDFGVAASRVPMLTNTRTVAAVLGLDVVTEGKRVMRKAIENTVKMGLEIVGDPGLIAKVVVRLKGMGKRLSGKYYVKSITHKINSGGKYTCSVKAISDGHSGYKNTGFQDLIGDVPEDKNPPGNTEDACKPEEMEYRYKQAGDLEQTAPLVPFLESDTVDTRCRRYPPGTTMATPQNVAALAAARALRPLP